MKKTKTKRQLKKVNKEINKTHKTQKKRGFFKGFGFLSVLLAGIKSRLKHYFTVPVHTKARYHLFGIFVAAFSISFTLVLTGYNIYKKVFALNESTKSMPQNIAFNAAGYSDNGGLVAVLSSEVRIATSSAWLDGAYLYKKTITLKNLSGQNLTASASAQVVVNTKELYDAGKLQNDCDDLRVAFVATQSANLRQELPRSITLASGASNCADSQATIVTFPRKEPLWNGASDSNYELYYGNANATNPGYGDDGFNIYRADGSVVEATLVCPFNGSTTCADGETPTTETGAIRYSGGKGALQFDGKDDYVSIPNISELTTGSGTFTLEGWFYLKGQQGNKLLLGKPEYHHGLSYSYNSLTCGMWQGTSQQYAVSASVSPGTWFHAACQFDSTTNKITLYVNGNYIGETTFVGTIRNAGTTLYVGNSFSGLADEVRLSTNVRYTSNFTPQTTPFEPDQYTKLLLHFDENGDDPRNTGKAIDSSGNGNHGTIYGANYVSGLIGVDSSSSDTGAVSIQPYAGHSGIFIEEGTTNLITNPSFENTSVYNKGWSLPYFNYATSSATFTPNMAKRNSAGPFAAGVMTSGDLANSQGKTDDVISIGSGSQISGNFYSNFDTAQGSVVLWWTPEYSYDASSGTGLHYLWYISSNYYLAYDYANDRFELKIGGQTMTASSQIIAGTTYKLTSRWDTKNKLDGTNYASLTIDGTTTFGITTQPAVEAPASTIYIGTNGTTGASSGIIEGLTVYRRPLHDSDNSTGINVGNGDEVTSSASDPTLTTGSWDVVFALPTNASTGTLSSGTGNAWSHPHASNLLYTSTTNTGGFMMNGTYTSDGWADLGTPTSVSALATNEKIYAGGYKVTSNAANQGIYRSFSATSGGNYVLRALGHSDGTCQPRVKITRADGSTEISHLDGTTTSTRTSPDVYIFTWQSPAAENEQVQLINTASSGTCYWHQVEVLSNMVINPGVETGSGTPWTPTSWWGVMTGTSTQETSIVHSGTSAYRITGDAGTYARASVGRSYANTSQFVLRGGFGYVVSGSNYIATATGGDPGYSPQTSATGGFAHFISGSLWKRYENVVRRKADASGDTSFTIGLSGAGAGDAVYDDFYQILLSDVSLTVTPANQSNSTETSGLRVDGGDTLTQAITGWTKASGSAKFKFTPRHSFDVADKFGFSQPIIASAAASTNNDYLKLYKYSSSVLRLEGKFNGTTVTADWSNPTLNAGTTYQIEMGYSQNYGLWLSVDGVERARATGVVPFGNTPTTMYFGSDGQGANQYDGTITSFVSLTPTENTTAPYYKFGSKSVKLLAYDMDDLYTIPATPSATATHTLSAYVYDGTSGNVGGTVDSTVAQLASASASLSTTYTDMGGGWWRLTASPSLPAGTHYLGVKVKPGKTVYVDGVQLEQKAYATTYADGSLGTGYAWTGTENESGSTRSEGNLRYSRPTSITREKGSISLWLKPNFNWISGKTTGLENYCIMSIGNNECGYPYIGLRWYDPNNGDPRRILGFHAMQPTQISLGIFPISDNSSWKHVVFTWDTSDSIKIYENGSLDQSASPQTPTQNLGSYVFISNQWPGVTSDIRIFDKPLTASEVADLYYQGLTTHQSGSESDDRYESGTYTYISPVIDLSANGAWGTTPISFTQFLNGGTISYYTRTSPDNITWSDWAAVSGNNIASDPRRYFQWKAEMSPNSALNDSPVINGMTVSYVEDTTAPQNPEAVALGYSTSATASADLTSGNWYNYPRPKFTWEAGEDIAAEGQSASGIDGYHLLLTTDQNATPSANLGDSCYLWAESDQRQFIVGTSPSTCSLEDGVYYLRLQTKDNSGNTSNPVTLFTYKYDGSIPNAPASVSTTNVGYQAVNSFTFYWPAATDNGPSGLKGYEYKTGATSGEFSQWQFTTSTTVTNIPAYQEGQNFFYVRSVDNAGNYSGSTSNNVSITSFYYNQSAPTAPQNVVISPATSVDNPASSNVFTVTWDKPANYSGEIAKYYYCVNCTPSSTTMTETTAAETINRKIENVALATQQGKNTFYIVAEDNNINTQTGHGNRNFEAYAAVDFYASTVAPGAPTNLTISDASDKANSLWRLTLVWKAPTTGGTPAKYEVYRSTDNLSFSFIGFVTSTAYTDSDLTYNQTYYYKVKALDNAGSSSIFSNTVSLAPVGKYYDPPSAGGVPSAACGSTTCIISWSTSRATYGTVEYGKTSTYGSAASETTAVKDHSIKISGLAPGTTYHYRVLALDEPNLVGYDRSQAYSSDYTFTTLNTASISEVTVSDITLNSAIVSWKTSSLATSKVEYGETPNYGLSIDVSTVASESAHMVKLTNLKHSTKYHFRVRGTTVDGDDIFSEDNSFTTLIFPKVSAVVFNTEQGEGGTSVILAWATNVKTTSEVEYQAAEIDKKNPVAAKYKTTEDLKKLSQTELASVPIIPKGRAQTVYNLNFDTKHLQRITGLADSSIYVFTIRGRDEYGNQVVSDPIRYVTGSDTKPPVLKNVIIETPISGVGTEAKAQIIISWETDEPALGQVIWGPGVGSEYPFASEKDQNYTTKHIIILRDLAPTSSYHLKILSHDKNGNKTESQDTVVVTPTAQQAALDIILKNLEDIFGFLRL